jgi:hypothetical protein
MASQGATLDYMDIQFVRQKKPELLGDMLRANATG